MIENAPQQFVSTYLDGSVLTITLNRPQVHNALNPQLIGELTHLFLELAGGADVRAVVLTGSGRSFCAGADLASMVAAAGYDFEQNQADGEAIFDLMLAVDRCPVPVIGRINGAAIGGGVGLVCSCDMVVAVDRAVFGFSEVRLGLLPAIISPFVLNKIGAGPARELFLTGERISAQHALRIGLVHRVVGEDELDAVVTDYVDSLLAGAPGAQTAAKALIRTVPYQTIEEQRRYTTELLAQQRASGEGREGMDAFLQKRRPFWKKETDG